jgi:ferric-dicitrate binding protein FerR (iron transport regulator)
MDTVRFDVGLMSRTNLECRSTRELVSLALDGELSELDGARLDAHLAACAACCELRAELEGLTAALRAAPLERLERPITLPQRVRWSLRPLQVGAAAAAVAVAAGLAGVVGTVRSHPAQPKFVHGTSGPTDGVDTLRSIRRNQLIPQVPVGQAGGRAKV